MYIDTHCHLQFEQYNQDRETVIKNAIKSGVKQFIIPAVDPLSVRLAIDIADSFPGVVHASIGFHPYEASHNPDIRYLSSLLRNNTKNIVAIGEIGLDYHLFKGEPALGKKQEQKILFEEQLRLALQYNLPVIMHCRDAYEDFFDVIDALPSVPRGVVHCFSGGLQELRFAIERKLFLGVDGNVTYSKQLQTVIPKIPVSSMLLETDAPYLTPIPHRGERNEPKYIPLIGRYVAGLYKTEEQQIADQTTANARLLFDI